MSISIETLALAKKHANSTDGDYMTIDSALSDSSTNPVQNRVVKAAIDSAKKYVDDAIEGNNEKLIISCTFDTGFINHGTVSFNKEGITTFSAIMNNIRTPGVIFHIVDPYDENYENYVEYGIGARIMDIDHVNIIDRDSYNDIIATKIGHDDTNGVYIDYIFMSENWPLSNNHFTFSYFRKKLPSFDYSSNFEDGEIFSYNSIYGGFVGTRLSSLLGNQNAGIVTIYKNNNDQYVIDVDPQEIADGMLSCYKILFLYFPDPSDDTVVWNLNYVYSDTSTYTLVLETPILTDGCIERISFVPDPDNSYASMISSNIETYSVNKDFVITLTPTALDFSGTMDKTSEQIWDAYCQGQRFKFSIPSMNAEVYPTQFLTVDTDSDTVNDAVIIHANIMYTVGNQLYLIGVATSTSASTYSTTMVPMTASN